MTIKSAVAEWCADFRREWRRQRHDEIVQNILVCLNPTPIQAVRMLPKVTRRLVATFVPRSTFVQAAIGLAIILLAPQLLTLLALE